MSTTPSVPSFVHPPQTELLRLFRDKGSVVNTASWSTPSLFGLGVPTKQLYNSVWLAQKGHTNGQPDADNLLDVPVCWTS